MTRLLLRRLLAALSGEDDGTEGGDESQFTGSLLDWSVNYGHGPDGGRGEAAREMAQIQEKAEMLDEQEQYRR
ncbi:hypothetical protein [Haloarcula salinisoli]|uniref:Uncharacterized protein n=1 Tax=Haloarcula salinisoli TaxID=2487746 RepID=A0A8J7YKU0_9EURY|nr:hypothetical protein [Halomicroarcula salinisoli]MBX0305161.1 hypothetical protein [Halomicroarcula salinisoli]